MNLDRMEELMRELNQSVIELKESGDRFKATLLAWVLVEDWADGVEDPHRDNWPGQ